MFILGVGKERFKQMLKNILKRKARRREAKLMKKLRHPKSRLQIQWRILMVIMGIVLFLMLSGCSGNYTYGDSLKMYCQPVEGYDIEKLKVTDNAATIEK